MKVFHFKSLKYISRLFDEYSVNTDPQNVFSPKALSLEQFAMLTLERDFFNPKVQFAVIKAKVIYSIN